MAWQWPLPAAQHAVAAALPLSAFARPPGLLICLHHNPPPSCPSQVDALGEPGGADAYRTGKVGGGAAHMGQVANNQVPGLGLGCIEWLLLGSCFKADALGRCAVGRPGPCQETDVGTSQPKGHIHLLHAFMQGIRLGSAGCP